MQKLTKEQADLLIKQIDNSVQHRVVTTLKINEASDVIAQIRVFVNQAINAFTEKGFPLFDMEWKCTDDMTYSINLALRDNEILMNALDYSGDRTNNYFPFEEFIKFTEGCQKICEWLKEQS